MANSYFTLKNSNNSVIKKFTVAFPGYQPGKTKNQSEQITLDGIPDISMGSIIERHVYTVKVREVEDRSGYGDKDDLTYFYELNNPNGTPTNLITMIDHYGTTKYCWLVGDHIPSPMSTELSGGYSWWLIQCTFRIRP